MTQSDDVTGPTEAMQGRRRAVLRVAGAGAGLLSGIVFAHTATAQKRQTKQGTGSLAIRQPGRPSPQTFMAEAARMRDLALKAGDQGFGAVVVKGQGATARIVGLGPSRVVSNGDPTAHAEMEAVRDACRRLKTRDLSDCTLYSTFRPCRMCESGAYWARVGRYIHGTGLTDGGAPKLGC